MTGPGQYVAALFAGSAGFSRACRATGARSRGWDILDGAAFDLTRRQVQQRLFSDAKQGRLVAAMLGPPCSSLSAALDRNGAVRSREFPWGLPGLSGRALERCKQGNATMKAALIIIRQLDKLHIPWILEQPASSKAWFLPSVQRLADQPHTTLCQTDFCMHGSKWRKRPRFLCSWCDPGDCARLQVQCRGRHVCQRSGRAHFTLSGSAPGGVPWTRIAQPYPAKLCRHLVHVLTSEQRLRGSQLGRLGSQRDDLRSGRGGMS